MAVPSVNITINSGTNFQNTFTMKNSDGTVIDLTGYSGTSKIRKYPTDSLNVQSFAVGINSTAGLITISMESATTAELGEGRNYYDVILTNSDGDIYKVIEGTAIVNPTVSV